MEKQQYATLGTLSLAFCTKKLSLSLMMMVHRRFTRSRAIKLMPGPVALSRVFLLVTRIFLADLI
jgi:hypothetical protein